MAQITEDYCNFETAELLKGKGFDVPVKNYYSLFTEDVKYNLQKKYGAKKNWNSFALTVSRPSQSLVMKWLREVHGLYIDIVTSFSQDNICYTFSCFNIMDLIQGTKGTSYHEYQTHEEVCESAIRYCLENLI